MDIFRMTGETAIDVKLQLSLMAKNILVEEYPDAERSRPQTAAIMSSRDRALPGFCIKSFRMAYSTWVSRIRLPFFSRV